MSENCLKLEEKDIDSNALLEEFDLSKDELFEVEYNLLGFFGTLQKIKWRLEKEGKL